MTRATENETAMTKLSTFQKRYGEEHTKPTRKHLLHVLVRWQRLLASPTIREEIDKRFASLGYQGSFRECLELTEMMIAADKDELPVQLVKDVMTKEIGTVEAIILATNLCP